jgi:hypothetical protein
VKILANQSSNEEMVNMSESTLMHPYMIHKRLISAGILQKKGPCQSKVMHTKPEKSIRRLEASDKETHLLIFLLNFGRSPKYGSMVTSWSKG